MIFMLKKILATAILAVALTFNTAPNTAEAYDHFVGTSESTGWECFVMTETIERSNGSTFVTLKMVKPNGSVSYLDYKFWYDSSRDVMRFSNNQGFSGIANRYETPIEWEMVQVIRQF
jgi:hypothetical protein